MEICRLCGNEKNNKIYDVEDRRIANIRKSFPYLHCSKCGAFCLNEEIDDLGYWYQNEDGAGYYAYIKSDEIKRTNPMLLSMLLNINLSQKIRSKIVNENFSGGAKI